MCSGFPKVDYSNRRHVKICRYTMNLSNSLRRIFCQFIFLFKFISTLSHERLLQEYSGFVNDAIASTFSTRFPVALFVRVWFLPGTKFEFLRVEKNIMKRDFIRFVLLNERIFLSISAKTFTLCRHSKMIYSCFMYIETREKRGVFFPQNDRKNFPRKHGFFFEFLCSYCNNNVEPPIQRWS